MAFCRYSDMNRSTTLALASVPAAAGFAWRGYRKAAERIADHPWTEPDLPGERRELTTHWGSLSYRFVQGDNRQPPLVLIHGWGKSGDSAWWPLMSELDRNLVVVDLPGHGFSSLHEPFTFALAAEAVERAVVHAEVNAPVVVAHSMGAPVALTSIRRGDPWLFSGLIVMASSAYWVRPRIRVMMAMAPYAMAPGSPFLVHTQRTELRESPELAPYLVWAYSRRPSPRVLNESAACLRRFDARRWFDLSLPPTTWVVTTEDGVLAHRHQRASARYFDTDVVEVAAPHSLVVQSPEVVSQVIADFEPRAPEEIIVEIDRDEAADLSPAQTDRSHT